MGSEVYMIKVNNSIIVGRNSFSFCCKEILFFNAKTEGTKKLKNIEISPESSFAYILNGTCGANEKNLSISTLFAERKEDDEVLSALDLTKLALERANNAEEAVDVITKLIDQYNKQEDSLETSPKYSFFICDMNDAYVLDILGKNIWAAEKITDDFRAFNNGFSVKTKIDKKSDGLEDKLKDLGLYDGSGELNFSEAVSMNSTELKWPNEPSSTSEYSAQQMFEVLRASAEKSGREVASSFVAVLKSSVSVYWFTGTQNPCESVFKPFIFTTEARISPLTSIKGDDEDDTLLRKLHANRKWEQVGDLLKSLEKSCVDEVDGYVDNVPISELDDLLKDCVEAEVKFYR